MPPKRLRPSPSASATQFPIGTKKKGNDGNLWETVTDKNDRKRWKKISTTSPKRKYSPKRRSPKRKTSPKRRSPKRRRRTLTDLKKELAALPHKSTTGSYVSKAKIKGKKKYYILDNGGLPLLVRVKPGKIGVFSYDEPGYEAGDSYKKGSKYYTKLVKKWTQFDGYWAGYDNSPGRPHHGNSILIQLTPKSYVYIGDHRIFQFRTTDRILDYVSPVGNSAVPTPAAYGEKYIYFLLDAPTKKVKREAIEEMTEVSVKNAYMLYSESYFQLKSNSKLLEDLLGMKMIWQEED